MEESEYPKTITVGSVAIKVYSSPNKGCPNFTVVWYDTNRKRHRKNFKDCATAETEAKEIALKLSRGEDKPYVVGDRTRFMLERALEHLRGTGVALDVAAAQYADAVKHLNGGSLVDAVRFYAQHNGNKLDLKSVREVVDELVALKSLKGRSELYVKTLRLRLHRFSNEFECPLNAITTADIERFLTGFKSGRTRNNFLGTIGTLFRFAKSRKYVAREHAGVSEVERDTTGEGEIAVFTPEEVLALLTHANAALLPAVAVGAFAGVRSEELKRLRWSDINFREGHIEVTAKNAKTRARRLIPITPNLRAWLLPHSKADGPITTYINLGNAFLKLAKHSGVKWRRNGLRHSFISYRMAETDNENKTALESGNSPKMIFRNYRKIVSKQDAKRWFEALPQKPVNATRARKPTSLVSRQFSFERREGSRALAPQSRPIVGSERCPES